MKPRLVCSLLHLSWSVTLGFYPESHNFRSTWALKASTVDGLSVTTSNSSFPNQTEIPTELLLLFQSTEHLKCKHSLPFPEHKQFNTPSFPPVLATLFLVFFFIQSSWSLQINRAQLHLVSSHLTLSELVPCSFRRKQYCLLSRSLLRQQ